MRAFFLKIYLRIQSSRVARYLQQWISPAFLVMLLAASLLWYISKLSHTYTTELGVRARIDNIDMELNCVVEGVGTNLVSYKLKGSRRIKIALSELRYEHRGDSIEINATSLLNAISVRFSDIKVVSVDAPTRFKYAVLE